LASKLASDKLKKTLQEAGYQQFIGDGLNVEALDHGALDLWSDTYIRFATGLL
jgi:hypothetical protein